MENLIKIKDFAKILGVAESTVRTWRRRHDIPEECFLVLGNTVFIIKENFENYCHNKSRKD